MKITDIKYALSHWRNDLASISRDLKSFIARKPKVEDYKNIFIRKMFFDTINTCNAKCVFCAYRKISDDPKYRKGIMSFEIFKKSLDQFIDMGGDTIGLTPIVGDPLMDPGLMKKIEYAAGTKKLKKIYFYSNGILLCKNDMYKKLVDSGISNIEISTQGCDENFFNDVYGVPMYDQFIKGLSALLDYNKKMGEPVSISINFRPAQRPSDILSSPDFIKKIKPFFSKKVNYSFMIDYDNWGDSVRKNDLIGKMKLKRAPWNKKIPCSRSFDVIVLFDGSVRLCAARINKTQFDDMVIGDINKTNLRDIFFSDRVAEIRRKFIEKKYPDACVGCSLYVPAKKSLLTEK